MKSNKKGQVINTTSNTVIAIMIMIFIVFAALFGIAALNPGSFFTAGSAEQNATNQLQANLTGGVAAFGQRLPTAFIILGVVLVLSFLAILILIVRRFGGGGGGGNL